MSDDYRLIDTPTQKVDSAKLRKQLREDRRQSLLARQWVDHSLKQWGWYRSTCLVPDIGYPHKQPIYTAPRYQADPPKSLCLDDDEIDEKCCIIERIVERMRAWNPDARMALIVHYEIILGEPYESIDEKVNAFCRRIGEKVHRAKYQRLVNSGRDYVAARIT